MQIDDDSLSATIRRKGALAIMQISAIIRNAFWGMHFYRRSITKLPRIVSLLIACMDLRAILDERLQNVFASDERSEDTSARRMTGSHTRISRPNLAWDTWDTWELSAFPQSPLHRWLVNCYFLRAPRRLFSPLFGGGTARARLFLIWINKRFSVESPRCSRFASEIADRILTFKEFPNSSVRMLESIIVRVLRNVEISFRERERGSI